MNLPNKITTARVCLVPVFMAAFYLEKGEAKIFATIIFIIASLTDFFDGYLARKYNLVTNFGKIMDAIADKVLVCAALVMLTETERISAIITLIFISREFLISGLRTIAAKEGTVIAAGKTGKLKTATQMTAIILFLLFDPGNPNTFMPSAIIYLANITLYLALGLSILSAVEYLNAHKELFKDR